jgi:putative ABC transport system ATP-binding protein
VILADEPTGALDDDTAHEVVELLFEVHRDIGATLVIVTHDSTVARHAQRLVHLDTPEPEPIHAH